MNSTLNDIRDMALRLPETVEATHFGMPSFEVGGRHFLVLQKGKQRALLYVSEADARVAIAQDPGVVEESRRRGKFEGIWVDLTLVARERLERLIEVAWRAKRQ